MKEQSAAEVSPSVRGETRSAACLFSIFKVPSLLLRDATVGEVRKYPGGAINPRLSAVYLRVEEVSITHGFNKAFLCRESPFLKYLVLRKALLFDYFAILFPSHII